MVLSQGWCAEIPLSGLSFVEGRNAHSKANAVYLCFVLGMLNDLIMASLQTSMQSEVFYYISAILLHTHTYTHKISLIKLS